MKRVALSIAALATVALAVTAYLKTTNAESTVRTTPDGHTVYINDAGLAASGYDVVGYFAEGKPIQGTSQYTATYQGANYQFASRQNQQAFEQDPKHFAPQYGGYCAWGVAAQNDLFPTQPDLFEIVDDKLYLNFNKDVQTKWVAEKPGFIKSADKNWPGLAKAHPTM